MIVDINTTFEGGVLEVPQTHIAFAAVQDGHDVHVAVLIEKEYWPQLAERGEMKLGDFVSHQVGDKTLHALICFSWGVVGWRQTPEMVTKCLDSLDVAEDETLAVYLMGSGTTANYHGANIYAILGGIARSKKRVVVYA